MAEEKKKRVHPPRTDKIREQDRKRQQAAEERRRERQQKVGARTLKGEIYGATSERLAAMVADLEAEEFEVIANLIHRVHELRERDPVAYAALTSHKPLTEVWHG